MKKVLKYLILMLLLFIFPMIVKANSISNIDIDIYVDKNGTAHVTEVWSAYINQGTEGYKPYYNLGAAKITNFKVSENGKQYTSLDNWNTSSSFNSKAYKNGINYISDGLELCWGISYYGNHNYKLTYDIEGFIATNSDSDMIYWTLIPHNLSSKPSNVHIKIYSDHEYSNSLPVWGYGNYGGTAYVYDGYIEINSEGTLESNEYMTILVKFDKGTFNTYNKVSNNFNYYYEMAEKGAVHYEKESLFSKISFMLFQYSFIFVPLLIIFIIILASLIENKRIKNRRKEKYLDGVIGTTVLYFERGHKNLPKDVPNYRDIPFNKDIYRTFWIAETYNMNKYKSDFFGALLLKWLKEHKIKLIKGESKITKKEETIIDLTNEPHFDDEFEKEMFDIMKNASDDGYLEKKEFEKYCRKHIYKINKWFDKVIDYETEKMILEGKIEAKSLKKSKKEKLVVNNTIKEDAIKLKGLKNFLEEFSRIEEKEAIEVHMWEYYLIYAQILGIAKKVAKQFKKLYPELIENMEYGYNFDDVLFINSITYSSFQSYNSSYSRANDYSSGGGGFSSGGGGGGSFGGGSSGGGGFR